MKTNEKDRDRSYWGERIEFHDNPRKNKKDRNRSYWGDRIEFHDNPRKNGESYW